MEEPVTESLETHKGEEVVDPQDLETYLHSIQELPDELKLEHYPKVLAKIIARRDIEDYGIFFSSLSPAGHTMYFLHEILKHLNLEVGRVIGPGAKEFLITILIYTVDLYLPYAKQFSEEIFRWRIKLIDLFNSVEDWRNAFDTANTVIENFTGTESVIDQVKVYLKLADCSIELEDTESAKKALDKVEKLADSSTQNYRMSKRPSALGSTGERTFYQFYQMLLARLECLKGEYGYASHIFWQLSLEKFADTEECRQSAILCCILTEGKEQESMYITFKPHKDINGAELLRKIMDKEEVVKEDLESISEFILPKCHIKQENGLSFLEEKVLIHQLKVLEKKNEKVSLENIVSLFNDVTPDQVLVFITEAISRGEINAQI
jgi:hypothetical protein